MTRQAEIIPASYQYYYCFVVRPNLSFLTSTTSPNRNTKWILHRLPYASTLATFLTKLLPPTSKLSSPPSTSKCSSRPLLLLHTSHPTQKPTQHKGRHLNRSIHRSQSILLLRRTPFPRRSRPRNSPSHRPIRPRPRGEAKPSHPEKRNITLRTSGKDLRARFTATLHPEPRAR